MPAAVLGLRETKRLNVWFTSQEPRHLAQFFMLKSKVLFFSTLCTKYFGFWELRAPSDLPCLSALLCMAESMSASSSQPLLCEGKVPASQNG